MPDVPGPFIHIMGIGVNTDHVRTVAKDKLFKPIERIYLIPVSYTHLRAHET